MLNKRYESSIINLRVFHNWIKNSLYTDVSELLREDYDFEDIKILELAVGKGGDLFKWIGIGATKVVGVDIDKDSVFGKNGALHRYKKKLNTDKNNKIPKCYFYVDDLSDPGSFKRMKERLKDEKFNIISCQFAIHYFFASETALKNIANIVGHFLEPNGYFIGTTMNPDKLNELFSTSDIVEKDAFTIESKTDLTTSYTPYGNRYIVSLGKKDEDHYFGEKPSEEFMIDKKELESVLKKVGVNLIKYKNFEEYYDEYVETDPDHLMTDAEKEFSFLNLSFVFQKI